MAAAAPGLGLSISQARAVTVTSRRGERMRRACRGGLWRPLGRRRCLWPHDDPTFPALTWEREDGRDTKVWVMLGPNDSDPPEADIVEEWQRRHEDWQQDLRRKNP